MVIPKLTPLKDEDARAFNHVVFGTFNDISQG